MTNAAKRSRYSLRNMFRRSQVSIGTRLAACFVAVVLLMFIADVFAIWQVRRMAVPVRVLNDADETSFAVVRVHLDVDSFRGKVSALESNHDIREFANEAASLRRTFLEDVDRAEQLLRRSPKIEQNAEISSTLETLKIALPSQLDTAVALATAGDWTAVRLRLSGQIQDLLGLSSSLVDRVEQKVLRQRTTAIAQTQQARQQLLMVVPVAGLVTLLAAAALGWYVTRTITVPLSELAAGAEALSRGDFQHQVVEGGDEELAVLSKAFNYTSRQLQLLYDGLRKSEERWRSVFENSAIGVALTDPDGGRFLATNHVYQKMLGYTEEELRALSFLDVTPEEYREANWGLATELLEGKRQQYQMEKQYVRKDGSLISVSVNVSFVPGTDRVPRFFMALSEDITERKRAEEALRRSETYLAEGQRLAKMGSWAVNPKTETCIYWSEEMRQIFGLDTQRSNLPDREEFFQLMHPEDRDRFNERI
ncbi:MAG TPA: PAS domain S-box protein, partial [Candidatus Acidoferrum sp.]